MLMLPTCRTTRLGLPLLRCCWQQRTKPLHVAYGHWAISSECRRWAPCARLPRSPPAAAHAAAVPGLQGITPGSGWQRPRQPNRAARNRRLSGT